MPSYLFNWTSDRHPVHGKPSFSVNDMAINSTTTSLKLYGRGARGYGEGMQENLLRLLENFAHDVPPVNPTIGQLWYNISTGGTYSKGLKIFDGAGWVSASTFDIAGFQSDLDAKVNRVGDTMTGYLTLNAAPTANLHAATKKYVDDRDNLKISKAGDSMTDFLFLHSDPILSLHAATKAYVDFAIFQAFQNSGGGPATTILGKFKRNEQYADAGQTLFSGIPSYVGNELWGVYVNGVAQPPSSYTLTSSTSVTFSTPLSANDEVVFDIFDFVTPPSVGVVDVLKQTTTSTAGQTVVSVPSYDVSENLLLVWINGIKQIKGVSYNHTSSTSITFMSPLEAGSTIDIRLIQMSGTGVGLNYQTLIATTPGQTSLPVSPTYYHSGNPADPFEQYAIIFINGAFQGIDGYVELNGSSILLSGGLNVGDRVEIYIFDLTP